MKRIFLFSLIFLLNFSMGLYAFDWKAKQYTIENTDKMDNDITLTLKDQSGNMLSVTYTEKISDGMAENIIKLNQQFRSWKSMQADNISFIVDKEDLQIHIVPTRFEYNGMNFMPHVPAGIAFVYSDMFKYNFRLVKDKFFLKIEGIFISEEKFCANLVEAIKDPVQYLQKTNPLYIINKISMLDESYSKLKEEHDKLLYAMLLLNSKGFFGGITPIEEAVIKRTITLKKENPKWEAKEILNQLEKEKFKTSKKAVTVILQVYFNDFK